MKKYIKYSFSLVLILSLMFIGSISVSAKTLGQLKKELTDAETKYENNQNEKQQTESEIASTKNKINQLNSEKVKVEEDMNSLNEEIKILAEEIEKMQKEMKAIINYYQLSNSNSIYLEYAFNATSFTDFIYRLAIAEQLSEYRKTTIDKYNNLVEENKRKLDELASKKIALTNLENELSVELKKLGNNLSSISEAAIDIKDEISELKKSISLYENTYKCSDSEDLGVCKERYNEARKPKNTTSNETINWSNVQLVSGIYRPVNSARINANYGYSSIYGSTFHYGIDIGVSHGTPVYSISLGEVVKITRKSSCGGNMVYITHTAIDGTRFTSGYFHLSSINVSEGDLVGPESVIGYSGGVPSIETWDGCSTGAHLHLQLGTGHFMTDYFWYSNFQARAFNPRNIISFPPVGSYFNGR